MLLAGYVLASAARGFASSNALLIFWGLAAVLVGPFLGMAAHEVRRAGAVRAACGVAVMSGILVGEGVYGLLYIADTTSPAYWRASIVAGVVLVGVVAVRRLREVRPVLLAAVSTAFVATAFVLAYSRGIPALLG